MGEFELIRRHFQRTAAPGGAVVLGIGDDCALLQPSPGHQIAISSDMLVEGRHFFPDVHPEALGHKALAVNLSDLAAMGARPLGFTLALALPHADSDWLEHFSRGLFALADAHACPLVGGDTTRGPLNLCITVFGEVKPGRALRRDAARADDDLYVSGRTGEARLALEQLRGVDWALAASAGAVDATARARLERPSPRNSLGLALTGLVEPHGVHAAIDLSDGLVGDLGHILQASGVGAEIHLPALPVASVLQALPPAQRWECLLAGGDDYEVLFTASPASRGAIEAASEASQTPVTRIGRITVEAGLRLIDASGAHAPLTLHGFDHFHGT